jgi:hypothetical protein
MYEFDVDPALLVTLVAGALALAFDYFPGVAKWFDGLSKEAKRGVNALGVVGFAVVLFAGQCFGVFATNLVCTVAGSFDLLYIIFLAITVNQGVHLALRPTPRMKARILGWSPTRP